MNRYLSRAILLLLSVSAIAAPSSVVLPASTEELATPKQLGWVSDYGGLLSQTERDDLSRMPGQYFAQTRHQMVLFTVKTIGSESIDAFSRRTANAWGLGYKGTDDGILVTVAVNERKARIELGQGMTAYISDAAAADIMQNALMPEIAKGNYYAGLKAGLGRLTESARAVAVPARAVHPQFRAITA